MKGKLKYFLRVLLAGICMVACVEPYDPPVTHQDLGILVVDSYLNGTTKKAYVKLQRSKTLDEFVEATMVTGADVQIESAEGDIFSLLETQPGVYEAGSMGLVVGKMYRLAMTLSDDSKYVSDFIQLRNVPPIQDVYWEADDEELKIYVDTEGAIDAERFYRWNFEETYEYHSMFNAVMYLNNGSLNFTPDDRKVSECWKKDPSETIKIFSTKNLEENKIRRFELQKIPSGDIRLSEKYSILVRQYTLSSDSYNYWESTKKLNENIGGLFDPIPSQLTGNIHNTENSNEPVIGYFDGSYVQEKRIFIDNSDLPGTYYYTDGSCSLRTVLFPTPGVPYGTEPYVVTTLTLPNGIQIIGYQTSERRCVDCTGKGGVTIKPDYWP